MDKQRLQELAGVQLNEMDMGKAVSQMADIFEAAIEATGVDPGSSDEWSETVSALADDLHDELRNRGLYG